jgi:hypothetical protein
VDKTIKFSAKQSAFPYAACVAGVFQGILIKELGLDVDVALTVSDHFSPDSDGEDCYFNLSVSKRNAASQVS